MKPTTIAFMSAQILDIFTTLVNLSRPGIIEANPFAANMTTIEWVSSKLFVAIVICLLMQRMNFRRWAWLIVGVASFPVFWNIGILILTSIK